MVELVAVVVAVVERLPVATGAADFEEAGVFANLPRKDRAR